MNEEYRNPEIRPAESDEMDIDWMGILAKLVKGWKPILIVTLVFLALGLVFALTSPRQYSVTVTLTPETRSGSGGMGNISTMLGLGGSGGIGGDAMNISFFPQICRSTPFLTDLFPVMLTPITAESGTGPESVSVFDYATRKKKGPDTWIPKLKSSVKKVFSKKTDGTAVDQSIVNPSRLTRKQARAVGELRETVSASVDKKTGITKITVNMEDPLMATQLADTVCSRLQEVIIRYRTQKATDDYLYYCKLADEAHEKLVKAQAAYAASVDKERDVILQSVNSRRERLQQEATLAAQLYAQMAQQRELARAKIQEEKPVYAVIQPATMPQRPIGNRKKTVLIWTFVGLFLACVWVGFGKDTLSKVRGDVKEKISEG